MAHPKNTETGATEFHHYPKHMYNGKFKDAAHKGDQEPVFIVVKDEAEEKKAAKKGWSVTPPDPQWVKTDQEEVLEEDEE